MKYQTDIHERYFLKIQRTDLLPRAEIQEIRAKFGLTMHQYQLDDKTLDNEFLAGREVHCRAVIPKEGAPINQGDPVLVILSSGKKYKGKVIKFEYFLLDGYTAGDLVIKRA